MRTLVGGEGGRIKSGVGAGVLVVGTKVGLLEGSALGADEGLKVGTIEGFAERVGTYDGASVGTLEG